MMRILIYGAGVQGTYLAHVLSANKNNVITLLARGQTAANLRENGVVIRHYFQKRTTVDKICIITKLAPTDKYDLIFVTMQYTHFVDVLKPLAQNVSPNIILVGNNLTAPQMQAYLEKNSLIAKNIGFGFQITGGTRNNYQTTCIRFGKGQMLVGSLNGVFPFQVLLDEAFRMTPYQWKYQQQMDDWLKAHAVVVTFFGYANYLHRDNVKKVAGDQKLLFMMVDAMGECFTALEQKGYQLIPPAQAKLIKNQRYLAYLFFKFYFSLPMAKFVDGSVMEADGLFEVFKQEFLNDDQMSPSFRLVKLVRDSDGFNQ